MPNERTLTTRCLAWLVRARQQGMRVWWLKTQSQGMQRAGVWDLLICKEGRFLAVELKHPNEVTFRPSPAQEVEGEWLREAGVKCLCTNDFRQFVAFVTET